VLLCFGEGNGKLKTAVDDCRLVYSLPKILCYFS